jgi:hypothetical protein
METPELTTQNQGDVNDQIAARFELIHKAFKGGLGEFFERLHNDRREFEVATTRDEGVIYRHLCEAAKCRDSSDGVNS